MIPLFNDSGVLPPGIHRATPDEIKARFGFQTEVRRDQMESIYWLFDLASKAGVLRIVLNGSFVTDIMEPIDVDCVLLIGPGFPKDAQAEAELIAGLPFLDIALADEGDFQEFVNDTFANDRYGVPKGMIEVILSLRNETELANTRRKLARLEARYLAHQQTQEGDAHVRELSMRSLKKYINQFKEEIARYEAHQLAQR